MKIIEKTCPNCGANIEFNKGDEKVKCEYCKKSYVIEEEKKSKDISEYNLKAVSTLSKGIIFTSLATFILIAICGLVGMIFIGNLAKDQMDDRNNGNNIFGKTIVKLDDINDKTKNAIIKESSEVLAENSQMTSFMYEQTEPYKQIGFYLLTYDNGNTIYDVYKSKYIIKGEEKEVFTAIKYENVKQNDTKLFGMLDFNMGTSNNSFMIGFLSNEDLYRSISLRANYSKISATKGLYTEK